MTRAAPLSGFAPDRRASSLRAPVRVGEARSRTESSDAQGFTLVELLVVLVMMATLLGVAVLAGGEISAEGRDTATRASMQAIRDAIVGGTSELMGSRSYRRDVGGVGLPRNSTTVPTPAPIVWSVSELVDGAGLPGWRGPYLSAPRATFGTLDADLVPAQPAGQRWVDYGSPNDWAIVDGWGRPIVLQVPDFDGDGVGATADERRHARLVSAGDNGRIDTPFSLLPNPQQYPFFADCGDDIVLYLEVADLRRQ